MIRLTNCTIETGGGKTPIRLRHNQNVSVPVSKVLFYRTDNEIFKYFLIIGAYGIRDCTLE